MSYTEALNEHPEYIKRKERSSKLLDELKNRVKEIDAIGAGNVAIFVAGSLGRMEFGNKSDIDFFLISEKRVSKLNNIEILGRLIDLNHRMGLPEFSNDGRFLKIHLLDDMIIKTGSPNDDHENLFTTRILLLLESKVISNERLYQNALEKIIRNYFKDKKEHEDFFPAYLINDILRYWRTLCLNYEIIRFDERKPWRKKNINLKYSRTLSVFATVLSILTLPSIDEKEMLRLFELCSWERLAYGLDNLNDERYLSEYKELINQYEMFLKSKDDEDINKNKELKHDLDKGAELFSDFLFNVLTNEKIPQKLRKYLII
jgi:predicted nucleotidyltransferase